MPALGETDRLAELRPNCEAFTATHFNLLTRAEVKMDNGFDRAVRVLNGGTSTAALELYQPAETLTHWRPRLSLSQAPISHWITVRFCNGCPGGAHAGMSQGLRVLVLASYRRVMFGSLRPCS